MTGARVLDFGFYKFQGQITTPPFTTCVHKNNLDVKVQNMKMDFNTGGTWRQVGQ